MSKERREQFALGHKKGKTVKNKRKILIFRRFLQAICLNHERITHITFFKEQIAHGYSFVKSGENPSSRSLKNSK